MLASLPQLAEREPPGAGQFSRFSARYRPGVEGVRGDDDYTFKVGFIPVAATAVTLTLHPGQTFHVRALHVGDVIACRTVSDSIRWKATVANVHTASFVWDKRLQLHITPRGGKTTVSCQRR
jgi:hypothetical protein